MIRLTSRGDIAILVRVPPEVVHAANGPVDPRCRAVVAGPGLGDAAVAWLRERLSDLRVPVVLDADGLDITLAPGAGSNDYWILTPHEGEFVRMTGEFLSANRVEAVRSLARQTGCVVLLKGPTTIVADPLGTLRVVRSGTAALATAGSGDVLAGLIGATIARGHSTLEAGALAAHWHGLAGAKLSPYGAASELPEALSQVLTGLIADRAPRGST